MGSFFGSLLVLVLMGLTSLLSDCLSSSLTSSQIVAGIVTIGLLLIHFMLGFVPAFYGDSFQAAGVFNYLSSQQHLADFTSGLHRFPRHLLLPFGGHFRGLSHAPPRRLQTLAQLIPRFLMKPISRIGIGSLVLVQLVLATVIFVSLAYLSANYFKVWDFTKDQDYTLSDLSEKILAKDSLAKRKGPHSNHGRLSEELALLSAGKRSVEENLFGSPDGNLEMKLLDPVSEPDAASRFASAYGLTLNTDLLLIDARPKGSSTPDPNLTRFLSVEDLIIFRTDQNNQRRPVGFQIEDRLATALLSASWRENLASSIS